jgi:hypothetical protein
MGLAVLVGIAAKSNDAFLHERLKRLGNHGGG